MNNLLHMQWKMHLLLKPKTMRILMYDEKPIKKEGRRMWNQQMYSSEVCMKGISGLVVEELKKQSSEASMYIAVKTSECM